MYAYLYNASYFSQKCVQNTTLFDSFVKFLHIYHDNFYEIEPIQRHFFNMAISYAVSHISRCIFIGNKLEVSV